MSWAWKRLELTLKNFAKLKQRYQLATGLVIQSKHAHHNLLPVLILKFQ